MGTFDIPSPDPADPMEGPPAATFCEAHPEEDSIRVCPRCLHEEEIRAHRERGILLTIARHTKMLIDNEANWKHQAWAIVNQLQNSLIRLAPEALTPEQIAAEADKEKGE